MSYNISFLDNGSLTTIFTGVSDASNGSFMLVFLVSIWIVLLLVFYDKVDTAGLFIGSGFLMTMLSGLMLAAGLIAGWVVIIPVIVVVAGILYKYMS